MKLIFRTLFAVVALCAFVGCDNSKSDNKTADNDSLVAEVKDSISVAVEDSAVISEAEPTDVFNDEDARALVEEFYTKYFKGAFESGGGDKAYLTSKCYNYIKDLNEHSDGDTYMGGGCGSLAAPQLTSVKSLGNHQYKVTVKDDDGEGPYHISCKVTVVKEDGKYLINKIITL